MVLVVRIKVIHNHIYFPLFLGMPGGGGGGGHGPGGYHYQFTADPMRMFAQAFGNGGGMFTDFSSFGGGGGPDLMFGDVFGDGGTSLLNNNT